MDSKTYIRACALFMFDQGKSTKETTQVISDLYPADAVTERNCARWFAEFRAGDRSLQDLPRSGRPQILDRQSLKAAVDADSSVTSRELAIEFGCCQKTIINGLHEIGKVCKRGRWIPFKLTENHKVQRMVTCQSMLSMAKKANFFDSILTGDEKWITFDNTHRGLQWLDPDQVPEGTPKPHRFVKKVMLCVWWNTKGIVQYEVLESGQTVNSDLYCLQLERVNQGLIRKGIDPTKTRLLHDNARPHVSVKTQQKIEELGWRVLPHAPYSPDLAPSDYHLFRSMEHSLRNMQFANIHDVRKWVGDFFASKPATFYDTGIRNLRERCKSTIATQGEYYID